jgi:hypothetical protein
MSRNPHQTDSKLIRKQLLQHFLVLIDNRKRPRQYSLGPQRKVPIELKLSDKMRYLPGCLDFINRKESNIALTSAIRSLEGLCRHYLTFHTPGTYPSKHLKLKINKELSHTFLGVNLRNLP